MLRMILGDRSALRLASAKPGRIDRRAHWDWLKVGAPDGNSCLEILTCTKGPGPAGLVKDHGHAWMRLWWSADDYVSVGFYPDESTRIDPEDVPGLRMPGMLLTPDKYDRVDWPRRSTRIPLRPNQFTQLVDWINALQADQARGSLAFDLVDRNCVGFVVRAAELCGVNVLADQPLLGFLPIRFPVPGFVTAATRPLRRLIYRFGLAFLGGRAVLHLRHTEEGPVSVHGIKPIFQSWSQILTKPVPFYHSRALQAWQVADAQDAQRRPAAPPQHALNEAQP